jgi:ceramide glucosyltransferase
VAGARAALPAIEMHPIITHSLGATCLGSTWLGLLPGSGHAAPAALGVLTPWLLARDAVFACALAPLLFNLFSAWAAWRFFGKRGPRGGVFAGDYAPPVSNLKPVCGLERDTYENFASFCRLDYPQYEILFAAQADDPVVPVIRRLMGDFPDRSIRLILSPQRADTPDKVAKLCQLAGEARHELLVISDSDVRVSPGYLRSVVAPFADPRVGGVTALYRAAQPAKSFGVIMDAVGSSGSFMGAALAGQALEGLKFALGPTMATRREILREIGGFEGLLDLHSDDYEFGKRIADRGYRVELARDPIDMQFSSPSLGAHMRHELRWLVGVRHVRPGGHLGMLFTLGLPWALAAALLCPSVGAASAWIGAYLAVRLGCGYAIGIWGLNDPVVRRWLWLLPFYDALFTCNWLASFFVNRIEWRGLAFKLDHGRMVPVAAPANRNASLAKDTR